MKINFGDLPWVSIVALFLVAEKTFFYNQAHPYPPSDTLTYGVTHLWYLLVVACFFDGKIQFLWIKKKGQIFVATAFVGGLALILHRFIP
jgi:hypothetical protein